MKRVLPSISFYAPYPGSALGYQLIAEGKSLMTKENYHRFPDDEKVKGVDYQFYRELLAGKYDDEVNQRPCPAGPRGRSVYQGHVGESMSSFSNPHFMYLFELKNGKKKLAYGESPEDALEILGMRLTERGDGRDHHGPLHQDQPARAAAVYQKPWLNADWSSHRRLDQSQLDRPDGSSLRRLDPSGM